MLWHQSYSVMDHVRPLSYSVFTSINWECSIFVKSFLYLYNYSSICKILPEMVIKTLAVGTTPIFSQSIFFIFSGICVPNLKTWNSCQMIRIKVTFNPSFFLFCTCYIFSKEVWQLCQQLRRATLRVKIAKNILL